MKTDRNKSGVIAAKAGVLAAAVLGGLGIAEAGVRLAGLAPELNRINPQLKKTVYRFSENPLLGYVFRENFRDPDSDDLNRSYPYINAHGFRDIERDYEKKPGVRRVILLGDSVVCGGANIRDLNDTISRKLEKLLEPEKIEVLNMGINGYCTRAEVELLAEKGLAYSPDLVILVFTNNDYHNINSELGRVAPPPPVAFLFVHSHLFRYLGVKFDFFDLRRQLGIQEIAGEFAGFLTTSERERGESILRSESPSSETVRRHMEGIGESNVHRALPILKEMAERHGFEVILGFWPTFLKNGIVNMESYGVPDLEAVFEAGELTVEKLALENGIAHFRFTGFFADDYRAKFGDEIPEGKSPIDYYTDGDSMHPNPRGAEVAARALARILEDNPNLLPPAP